MSCSVKSLIIFYIRMVCMSGSMFLFYVGYILYVKYCDCWCLILLILFLRFLIDGVNLNLIKKVVKCIFCIKLCFFFKFLKEKRSIFFNIYYMFCRFINMIEVKLII